jgi:hypothetical protein
MSKLSFNRYRRFTSHFKTLLSFQKVNSLAQSGGSVLRVRNEKSPQIPGRLPLYERTDSRAKDSGQSVRLVTVVTGTATITPHLESFLTFAFEYHITSLGS